MIRLLLPLVLLLSACGVDGAPVPPSQADPDDGAPRIEVSGSVGIGIGGRL